MIRLLFATGILLLAGIVPFPSLAQDTSLEESRDVRATITRIHRTYEERGAPQMAFEARTDEGEIYQLDTGTSYTEGLRYNLGVGDRVILQLLPTESGTYDAFLADAVRTPRLLWIFVLFAFLSILIGRTRGLLALFGLGFTFLILFSVVFPMVLRGTSPVLATLLGCTAILAVNMHLSHGINRQTFFAFLSTVSGLLFAFVSAEVFIRFAFLSGLATEEATMLYWQTNDLLPTGILLAGILLGATGVLDDIAITQTEAVSEIHRANPKLTPKELYTSAMRIGRHHIASTVNTLVLAYAGASLPLFLLFLSHTDVTASSFINIEPVAEELVRTIAGTIGLLMTVPISTALAVFVRKTFHLQKETAHTHT